MAVVKLCTLIRAPRERVFDLARSIDAHRDTTGGTQERAVAGVTSGADRGQSVCREGPYRFCRHPGYLGGLIFGLTTPLVLGSFWALIPQGLAALLLVGRTVLEDRMLKKDLLWYAEYAADVRSMLIPGLW